MDNGTRRTIVWDEDNRIREVQDPKHGAAFSYDDQGERKLKKSRYGETAYITQFFTVRNGAIASTHVYAGTTRIATKVGAGRPVGKVGNGNNIRGTGNLSTANASLTEYVAPDGSSTTATPTTLAPVVRGQGEGQARRSATTSDKGQSANTAPFPGQGIEHRSERANEVARNTEKNKHLNGGDPGGAQGSANSNAGGNDSNAGGNANNAGGNAWGRQGERGNSGHVNNSQGRGQGNGSSNANGNAGGNGGGGSATGGSGGAGDGREFVYFYHPDHLGSSAYVTDEKAQRYEHLAYFPFGETWVQESTAGWRVPYQYTAKEMDSETGLYYFEARYYDPRTSIWQSADPILEKYLPKTPTKPEEIVSLQPPTVKNPLTEFNLPGLGGVFESRNINLYVYAEASPLRWTDPTGKCIGPVFLVCVVLAEYSAEIVLATEISAAFLSGAFSPESGVVPVTEAAATKVATVVARASVRGRVFEDVNQLARVGADAAQPTLIAARVAGKMEESGKMMPNGNMATAHAEIGAIQQAFNAGVTKGADMVLEVTGKAVCGYCLGDIAAMAEKAGLRSLQVIENATGNVLSWRSGMSSLQQVSQ